MQHYLLWDLFLRVIAPVYMVGSFFGLAAVFLIAPAYTPVYVVADVMVTIGTLVVVRARFGKGALAMSREALEDEVDGEWDYEMAHGALRPSPAAVGDVDRPPAGLTAKQFVAYEVKESRQK